MLRKTLLTVFALILALALPTLAQEPDPIVEDSLPLLSLEELLQNYYQAIGGDEAWLEVESVKMTGKMQMGPGMEAPFTVYSLRPDKLRLEFSVQGMTGIQVINGEEAWMFMPFMGKTAPETMPDEMVQQMRDQIDIEGPLIDWAAKGHTLEPLGVGEAQGTDAYLIKVTKASGSVETYYFDAEAFVPFLVEGTTTMQGTEVETETILSDFKEVDGLMMAHSIENRVKGQPGGQVITVETVDFDADLSNVEFEMPASGPAETADE